LASHNRVRVELVIDSIVNEISLLPPGPVTGVASSSAKRILDWVRNSGSGKSCSSCRSSGRSGGCSSTSLVGGILDDADPLDGWSLPVGTDEVKVHVSVPVSSTSRLDDIVVSIESEEPDVLVNGVSDLNCLLEWRPEVKDGNLSIERNEDVIVLTDRGGTLDSKVKDHGSSPSSERVNVALSIARIELSNDVLCWCNILGRVCSCCSSDGWRNSLADLDKVDGVDDKEADLLVEELELEVVRRLSVHDISARLVVVDLHVHDFLLRETVTTAAGGTDTVKTAIRVLLTGWNPNISAVLVYWVMWVECQSVDIDEEVNENIGLIIKDEVLELVVVVEIDRELGLFGSTPESGESSRPPRRGDCTTSTRVPMGKPKEKC